MGFLSRLFSKKDDNNKTGGMEDYMQLVRVYFQASIAANVGITNLAMLPDLRVFKSTLHVQTINNKLGLGKAGAYNRFRSNMLRKFHASQLYNDGLGMDEIDELQGRAKDQTRTSYFMENPLRLREKYIDHMSAVTINLDVEKLTVKSPEFLHMEMENREYKSKL